MNHNLGLFSYANFNAHLCQYNDDVNNSLYMMLEL